MVPAYPMVRSAPDHMLVSGPKFETIQPGSMGGLSPIDDIASNTSDTPSLVTLCYQLS